jgi:hypothetical protein
VFHAAQAGCCCLHSIILGWRSGLARKRPARGIFYQRLRIED